jgi:hypothetical protein
VKSAEIPWFSAATAWASPSMRSLNRSAENLDGHLAPKPRIAGSPHFDPARQGFWRGPSSLPARFIYPLHSVDLIGPKWLAGIPK